MENKYLKQIRNLLIVLAVFVVVASLKLTGEVSVKIVLAIFLFFMVFPVATALEKAGLPSFLSTFFAAFMILIVLAAAVWFIFYTVDILVKTLPNYYSRLDEIESLLLKFVSRWVELPDDYSLFDNLSIDWMGGVLMPGLRSLSSSAISIVGDVSVTFLLTVFLLLERSTLISKIIQISRPDKQSKVASVLDRIVKQVSKYLGLKTVISVATGILFYLTAMLAKLDFAIIWGVLAFVLNFIPTFGSIIISVMVIFMAVLQYAPDWTPVLIAAIGAVGTQMILGNIIDPRLQGNNMNLSPFIILVSLSIFGYIWGVVGMFLAVPLLSIIEIIFANMETTKGIAILLSSGSSFKKRYKTRSRDSIVSSSNYSDVFMPGEDVSPKNKNQ
ncbi:MAG: AI-2E family transporter [Sphaerochaetaceae bacterium]|nr:AI-2E family transporter [Sphaerochaetaceae bacterium]